MKRIVSRKRWCYCIKIIIFNPKLRVYSKMPEDITQISADLELRKKQIVRVTDFDPIKLVRKEQLGELAFDEALEPARRLIDLFRKLPTGSLEDFAHKERELISLYANSTFEIFDEINKFSIITGSDPVATRQSLITKLEAAYQPAFSALFPLISYGVARTVDFSALEARARSSIQAIADEKNEIIVQLRETADEASKVLISVREAAAEQGVTQMAKYFADEAVEHQRHAEKWLIASIFMVAVVLSFSVVSFFLHYYFVPKTAYESAQLIASKAITFVVLAFALFQCVRSYSAHRHNAVTNKHRQNALLTYKTLADAGNSPELRDVVLQHAAAAIYAPNDSGYLKSEERGYGAQSLIALATRSGAGGMTSGS